MRTFNIITLVVLLSAFGASTHAEEGGHSKGGHGTHKGHHQAKEGKNVTLQGKLIGLTCFIKHGTQGKTHKSCAKDCAEKGLPIGLISGDKIYQVSGDGHKSLVEAYKPLLKYMEDNVKIKGTAFEKNGMVFLVIDKIKKM